MRAILGVDPAGQWKKAIALIKQLAFKDPHVQLVGVIESPLPDGGFPDVNPDHPLASVYADLKAESQEANAEACAVVADAFPCEQIVTQGNVVQKLLEFADDYKADLIAVGSERKGVFGSLFLGSVGKGLVVGAQRSVLVAKQERPADGPVTAVLAVDHSKYSQESINALLSLQPQGIGKFIVVTATAERRGFDDLAVSQDPESGDDTHRWTQEKLLSANEDICRRLRPLSMVAEPMVREGHPNEVLRETMEETGAHLLIMGAQGHGFLERLTIGSISMHQVVSESYNVLVLRPSP
jgi:nucleotide-binding universal stress UspA family protein